MTKIENLNFIFYPLKCPCPKSRWKSLGTYWVTCFHFLIPRKDNEGGREESQVFFFLYCQWMCQKNKHFWFFIPMNLNMVGSAEKRGKKNKKKTKKKEDKTL